MTGKIKENKHQRYDKKRKNAPRLPSSRITNNDMANAMEQLYSLDSNDTKLHLITDAAQFALDNEKSFLAFRKQKNLKNK